MNTLEEHSPEQNETKDISGALEALVNHHAQNTDALVAKLELHESIFEHFPGGLCAFDKNMNMTICNERLKEILNYPPELFSEGLPTIEQLFRFKASRGEYGPGDVEGHVQSRLRLVEQGRPHRYERKQTDGTILEVRGRPLKGGGFVTTYVDVTEQRNHIAKVEALVDSFPGGICVFDQHLNMILCNETVRQQSPEQAKLFADGLPSMETYVLMNAALGIYGGGNPAQIAADRMNKIRNGEFVTSQHRQRSGKFTKISVLPLKDGGFVETQIDVTGERTRTLQLESIVENFPGGLSMFDQDLKLILHNDKFRELLDYPQELLGKENVTFNDMLRFNAKRGEFGDGNIEQIVADKLDETISSEPQLIERTRPDGTVLEIRIAPLEDGGFLATYVDITERVEQQAQAIKMANYSPIAGLPNRALFLDRLEIALAQAERGACMAVQHIDIHQFGQLNTALGQKTGDRILKVLGERFLDMKRDTDTFAHLGADEFAVVQVGIEGMEGAEILARRILRTIREPIEIDGQIHELDACIGIALAPENGTFSDEIQSKVDTALHNAKIVGPGMIMFFHNCANRISL